MEDLLGMMRCVTQLQEEMEAIRKAHFEELDQLFYGIPVSEVKVAELPPPIQPPSSITPQQTKKRPKRLTSLVENDGDETSVTASDISQRANARMSNTQLLAAAEEEDEANTTGVLMPPPPVPSTVTAAAEISLSSSGRPQRAAKLRSEKNLKEPPLNSKLRRPSNEEMVKVKVESEQRVSQMHSIRSSAITEPEVAPVIAPTPAEPAVVAQAPDQLTTNLRIKVKREKISTDSAAVSTTSSRNLEITKTVTEETTMLSTTAANNTTTSKKTRKKKEGHKPIKVERFSDLDKDLPVSSRTRKGSNEKRISQEPETEGAAAAPPQASMYEDAVENAPNTDITTSAPAPAPAAAAAAVNETITLPNATFNMPLSNVTMCLGDHMVNNNATFQVEAGSGADSEKEQSMKTARDGSLPETQNNSLMTEDESQDEQVVPKSTQTQVPKQPVPKSLKGIKMPARTHELFNPLLQSPVKMRVEAFENAASIQSSLRSRRVKDAATTGSGTTPIIGKLPAPTLGRFLTPTQSSSSLNLNSAQPKKAPLSACKATSVVKTATGTNLKSTNSGSSKTLTRENSGDDFRKAFKQLAEERKKQREQKHLQAAQLREAKERERAERLAKMNKEREEKRLKKQQEQERLEERKRLEMEELQRKLQQQEEAERLKKAKAKEQERELLLQMKLGSAKPKQMMPPPPKSKYTFEMLHEDDSTDDEGKVSYKRPPVPSWSRSHVRGPAMVMQTFCPTGIIDSFFSVEPQTPDLKKIFPNIDPSHLKRNSSVFWSTPPRYSELPKY